MVVCPRPSAPRDWLYVAPPNYGSHSRSQFLGLPVGGMPLVLLYPISMLVFALELVGRPALFVSVVIH